MNQNQIMNIKLKYYDHDIMEKILSYIYFPNSENLKDGNLYRTISILNNSNGGKKVAFRFMTFSSIYYFKKTYFDEKYKNVYLTNDSNFYTSIARVRRIPTFPFKERNKYTKVFAETEYQKYIEHFDLFFDMDIYEREDLKTSSHEQLIKERMPGFIKNIEKLIKIILQYNLKAEICFSGNRGFKIIIYNDIYNFHESRNLVPRISKNIGLKYCDNIGVFIPSKLMKMTYSIVFSKETNYPKICLPLKDYNYKYILGDLMKHRNFTTFHDISFWKSVIKTYENQFFITTHQTKRNALKNFLNDYNIKV